MGLERINEFKKEANITNEELATLSGVPKSTIDKITAGKTYDPKLETVRAIMKALGKTLDDLDNGKSLSTNELTPQERKIGRAYGKATPPVKRTVEVALEPYMEENKAEFAAELAPELPEDDEPEMVEMKIYDESAAAGLGDYLSGDSYEVMLFPANEVPERADFGVRISGNSMEPTIDNGAIAWVQAMPEVRNGDIGIFILNNNAFCKELYVDAEERRVYLVSHNDDYDDIPVHEEDDLRTVGKVLL